MYTVHRSRMMRGEESDGRVFKTVLFYCLLILVLPISTFFISKSLVFEWILGQVGPKCLLKTVVFVREKLGGRKTGSNRRLQVL